MLNKEVSQNWQKSFNVKNCGMSEKVEARVRVGGEKQKNAKHKYESQFFTTNKNWYLKKGLHISGRGRIRTDEHRR